MCAGFTLIELLVVIAISALLVSILVPSLGEAQWHTKVAVCSQNLHSVGIAAAQYVSSWGIDRPWLWNTGGRDGAREYKPPPPWSSWDDNPQPGNPAQALCSPDHEQFIDTPKVLFCPSREVNYEDNYDLYGKMTAGVNGYWGTYTYVYQTVNKADDPWVDEHHYPDTYNPVNARDEARELMMYDWWRLVPEWYDHYNALFNGGSVESLGRNVDYDDDPSKDDAETFRWGPTGQPD